MLRYFLGSVVFSCLVGVGVWLNPGHHGHNGGGALAATFIVFALVFLGPTGMTAED